MANRSVREHENFRQDVWDYAGQLAWIVCVERYAGAFEGNGGVNAVLVDISELEEITEYLYPQIVQAYDLWGRNPEFLQAEVRTKEDGVFVLTKRT